MADLERRLAKAGWPSRELHAAARGWKKGVRIKAQLRDEKRGAKRKIKKLLEDEMKITNSKEPFEVDTKRFYLPITIETVCPECGEKVVEDFTENYLMYPTTNVPFEHHLICPKEHEFAIKLTLAITLEEVKA